MLYDIDEEVMAITQEECAEVVQAISKCFRFGFNDLYEGKTNLQRLEEETGDLLCMIQLMIDRGIINESKVYDASVQKRERLKKWSGIFDEKQNAFIN